MRLLTLISILLYLLFIPLFSNAQHYEIGVSLGTSYYLGELNPTLPVINSIQPAGTIFVRKNLNKRYSLKYGGSYMMLKAEDSQSNSKFNKFRNASMSSKLIELQGVLEFNFFPYQINNRATFDASPYLFIGLAGFYTDPTVEGSSAGDQSFSYDATVYSIAIPFGFGVKFDVVKNIGMSVEWGMRKTFTDRLDALKSSYNNNYQLSQESNKDWYSMIGVSLNYKILTKSDRCPVAR
ncbi:DUF6089 family protein [bacterium]|nr:DUF6089 family protein [bacterium]